jgi:hypothetical protein
MAKKIEGKLEFQDPGDAAVPPAVESPPLELPEVEPQVEVTSGASEAEQVPPSVRGTSQDPNRGKE